MSEPTRRVLFVDDDDDIRRLVALSLERIGGFLVRTVASGRDAPGVAEEWCPDAIMLDVWMPEIDGPDTLQLLREREATRDIPIVFLTAGVHSGSNEALAQLHPAGVIEKPFDPLRLPHELARLLAWS